MSKAEVTEVAGTKTESRHPLMSFTPRGLNSFEEWKAEWDKSDVLEERLGLLHGLTLEYGWRWSDKIVPFLLDIANGHQDQSAFIRPEKFMLGCGENGAHEARQQIARKAFSVLCLRFFIEREENRSYDYPAWYWMLTRDDVFQKVLWFARPNGIFNRPYNCDRIDSDDHQQKVFRNFLVNLSVLGWKLHPRPRWDDSIMRAVERRLFDARPQLIDIINQLGRLDWLNYQELDPASLKKLTEMALEGKYFFPPSKFGENQQLRKPISLEEAVLGGSVAAQVVILHSIREKERKRIAALFAESQQRREEQQRQIRLEALKRQQAQLAKEAEKLQRE